MAMFLCSSVEQSMYSISVIDADCTEAVLFHSGTFFMLL